MRIEHTIAATLVAGTFSTGLGAETANQPLSVIDWLGQTQTAPAEPVEPPVTRSGLAPGIEVLPLGEDAAQVVGLVPSDVTKLPRDLWRGGDPETLARAFDQIGVPRLPSLQSLFFALLLTEALPPREDAARFQRQRLDALIRLGALEPALTLAEGLLPSGDPEIFARYFDLALLAGVEDRPCEQIAQAPSLAPNRATEIFCTARAGDWDTAVLIYGTADALGLIAPETSRALARFLDPDLFEGEPALPVPREADALLFTLYAALGQRLPTQTLPRVFAHADLSDRAGWKTQLEAAERLAATGAISDNRLLGLLSSRRAAASGGVWDRVVAIQRFDTALRAGSIDAVEKTLLPAWQAAKEGQYPADFATLFADELRGLPLSGLAAETAFEVLLLSPGFETAPQAFPLRARQQGLFTAIATGALAGVTGDGPRERAILAGLTREAPTQRMTGPAFMTAIADVEAGAAGDLARLPRGLAALKSLGQDMIARRAALEILLLEPAS